jgi:hypothetical protein
MSSDRSPASHRGLRRIGSGLLSLLIGFGAVVLLLVFLNSRDDAHVDPAAEPPAPGQVYSTPEQLLDTAQVRLLGVGDVYVVYGTPRAPPELRALREQLSGPPDPALEQAGQAVILVRRPGTDGVVALGGDHVLRTAAPADPALGQFASYWLGRGTGS